MDTDGKILTKERRKSFPNAVVLEKWMMAKEKREILATKAQVGKHLEKDILNRHSIFTDSEDDEIRLIYLF